MIGGLPEVSEHLGELFLDVIREAPVEDLLAGLVGALQVEVEILLAVPQPPAAVLDQVRVEHVRSDVERVVGFQQLFPARIGGAQDRPGQQHAEGFAPDEARADHAFHDGDEVFESEILARQGQKALVAGGDHLEQPLKAGLDLRLRHRLAHHPLQGLLGLAEVARPDARAVDGELQPGLGHAGQDVGDDGAAGDRVEIVALPAVEHVKRGRVALEDLLGMEVEPLVFAKHLQHDLGGVEDAVGGVKGVPVLEQRKVSHRLQAVEEGAGDHEEVAQHPVAEPVGRQVREAVKDVERPDPGLLDHVQDLRDEPLKALLGRQLVHHHALLRRDERLVPGKPEINDLAPLALRLRPKGLQERLVILDRVHLPNHIVAGQEPLQRLVQPRQSCAQSRHNACRPPGSRPPGAGNGSGRDASQPGPARKEKWAPGRAAGGLWPARPGGAPA